MPTILSVREVRLEFRDLAQRRVLDNRPRPRAPGLHLSNVLAHIAEKVGKFDRQIVEEDGGLGEYPWTWARGIMFEEYWFSLQPESTIWQPGEKRVNEVAMNPDGLTPVCSDIDGRLRSVIEETKSTDKKLIETGEEFIDTSGANWYWQHQVRGEMTGYPGVLTSRHTILFNRGDYKTRFGPVVMQYAVEYSKKEVAETWAMVQKFKGEVRGET